MSEIIQFPSGKRNDESQAKREPKHNPASTGIMRRDWHPKKEVKTYMMKADCREDAEAAKEGLADVTSDWKIEEMVFVAPHIEIVVTFRSSFFENGLRSALDEIEWEIYHGTPEYTGRGMMKETFYEEAEFRELYIDHWKNVVIDEDEPPF